MDVAFTAHNIRLDDGTFTKPDIGYSIDQHAMCVSAKRLLSAVFPGDTSRLRLVDLGCLEGGYSVEFARMGFQVLGLEVRTNNIAACNHVKARVHLPNLEFVQDDAWNVAKYGVFDAVFCCGLLYHMERPKQFLELLSTVTRKLLIVQTHFSTDRPSPKHALSSGITENEGLAGRWFTEFNNDQDFGNRDNTRWSSWNNRSSFWPKREYLIQAIHDAGFPVVMEQFDWLGPDVAGAMLSGYYAQDDRGGFVGMK